MLIYTKKPKWLIDRRRFLVDSLGGLGTLMALPVLEAMIGPMKTAFAHSGRFKHLVVYLFPQGIWWDRESYILDPLKPHFGDMITARNFGHFGVAKRYAGHGPTMAWWSTGGLYSHNDKIEAGGPSIQFEIARHVNADVTHYMASIERERDGAPGRYFEKEWSAFPLFKSATSPVYPELSPRDGLERETRGSNAGLSKLALERRKRDRQSALDDIKTDLDQLKKQMGAADKARLDQYTDTYRDLEKRFKELSAGGNQSNACLIGKKLPHHITGYNNRLPIYLDHKLWLHAFQDLSLWTLCQAKPRVVTLCEDNGVANRLVEKVINKTRHHAAHWATETDHAKLCRDYVMKEFGRFYQNLKNTRTTEPLANHTLTVLTRPIQNQTAWGYNLRTKRTERGPVVHFWDNLPLYLFSPSLKQRGKVVDPSGGKKDSNGNFINSKVSEVWATVAHLLGATQLTKFGNNNGRNRDSQIG